MAARSVARRGIEAGRGAELRLRAAAGGAQGKASALRAWLERYALGRIALTTFEGYQRDQIPNNAAAMTYFGIFSLFPLLLVLMAAAGFILQDNEEAQQQILSLFIKLLPDGQNELLHLIEGVIAARGTATLVGVLTLLWSTLGWFQVIDDNINRIWGVSTSRAFVQGKLFALAMVVGVGGVAGASFAATTALGLLQAHTEEIPGSVVAWQGIIPLVSFLITAGAFFALYRFAPQRRAYAADVWPAALITALLWEATRRVLAHYLERNDMISGYGPIGAAMALLFWLYVVSVIVLVGAELAHAIAQERRHAAPAETAAPAAQAAVLPPPKPAAGVGSYLVRGIATIVAAVIGIALLARRRPIGPA